MAKEQDLPVNPMRIAGACGRLMCCLKYEHPLYQDFRKNAPRVGESVETPEGPGTVTGHNVPGDKVVVKLRLPPGQRLRIPAGVRGDAQQEVRPGRDRCGCVHRAGCVPGAPGVTAGASPPRWPCSWPGCSQPGARPRPARRPGPQAPAHRRVARLPRHPPLVRRR
jgi:hypothetical protein